MCVALCAFDWHQTLNFNDKKLINPEQLHSIELYTLVSFLTVICPISAKFEPQYGDINH